MTTPVMLACGCAAFALHQNPHDGLPVNHPSCFIHECCTVVATPDLTGRHARCADYGHRLYHNECGVCGRNGTGVCQCERPSSPELPFFEYRGVGSPHATHMCRCGYLFVAHLPRWEVTIRVERRWYKIVHAVQTVTRNPHCATEAEARQIGEAEAARFRRMRDPETQVHEATVTTVRPVPSTLRCTGFVAAGPQAFDRFYCGCHSWD